MSKTIRLILLIPLLGILSACETQLSGLDKLFDDATKQNYANLVNSWQDANEEEVYHVWGYPNKVMDLPNKHKVLVYHEEESGFNPIHSTPSITRVAANADGNAQLSNKQEEKSRLFDPITKITRTHVETDASSSTQVVSYGGTISGGGSYDYQCTTWFELNKKSRVVNTSFAGNHCIATKASMRRYSYKGF